MRWPDSLGSITVELMDEICSAFQSLTSNIVQNSCYKRTVQSNPILFIIIFSFTTINLLWLSGRKSELCHEMQRSLLLQSRINCKRLVEWFRWTYLVTVFWLVLFATHTVRTVFVWVSHLSTIRKLHFAQHIIHDLQFIDRTLWPLAVFPHSLSLTCYTEIRQSVWIVEITKEF